MLEPPLPADDRNVAGPRVTTPAENHWVFFDVDRTVLRDDTFGAVLLTGFLRGPWRALFLLALWPLLLTPFMGLDWRWAKSTMLWAITVGRGRRGAVRFLRAAIGPQFIHHLRPEAAAEIDRWRRDGVRVCYVSGSAAIWLRPLLRRVDGGPPHIIATRLRFWLGGVVIAGPDCRGEEKVRRIEAALGPHVSWVAAYGDARSDLAMLARARRRVLVNPTPRQLAAWCRELGHCETADWPSRTTGFPPR